MFAVRLAVRLTRVLRCSTDREVLRASVMLLEQVRRSGRTSAAPDAVPSTHIEPTQHRLGTLTTSSSSGGGSGSEQTNAPWHRRVLRRSPSLACSPLQGEFASWHAVCFSTLQLCFMSGAVVAASALSGGPPICRVLRAEQQAAASGARATSVLNTQCRRSKLAVSVPSAGAPRTTAPDASLTIAAVAVTERTGHSSERTQRLISCVCGRQQISKRTPPPTSQLR